jgi:hypothetical protein
MAANQRNFEPNSVWSRPDGTPSERALGWMRSLFDFIGATAGVIPVGAIGGDGVTTTTFFREDGKFAVPAYPVAANPSASIGLTAANGGAATFMRSDATPALSLAITPTWTGAHIWSALGTFNAGLQTTTVNSSSSATIGTGFGCNGKSAQTSVTVNAAVAGTAGALYTATEQGILNNATALLNQIRAALIANGITG